jgi:tetratricopeptide (TPR) repeat protein
MKGANLPPRERRGGGGASDERFERKIPTEALTYYSRALLYQDRGEKDKAADMYTQALTIFPEYAEAQEGLQRVKRP